MASLSLSRSSLTFSSLLRQSSSYALSYSSSIRSLSSHSLTRGLFPSSSFSSPILFSSSCSPSSFTPFSLSSFPRLFSSSPSSHPSYASFSTSASSSSSISSSPSSSSSPFKVSVVSYYVGRLPFSQLNWPNSIKFTRPDCVLIPLSHIPSEPNEIPQNMNWNNSNNEGNKSKSSPVKTISHDGKSSTSSAKTSSPTVLVDSVPSSSIATRSSVSPSQSIPEAFSPTSPFCILFSYGAAVFFSSTEFQQQTFFNTLQDSSSSLISNTNTSPSSSPSSTSLLPSSSVLNIKLRDDYKILIDPTAFDSSPFETYKFVTDAVIVKNLDIRIIRLISQVLAQTVGMEFYEGRVAQMLEEFRVISSTMGAVGDLNTINGTELIKLLSENNVILTEVLISLRVLDRSEIVWRFGELEALWIGLRNEFDLQQRFDAMDTKLKMIHDNHPLMLELLHHKKSTRMEIIIIALIAIEVVLSVAFHSPLTGWLLGPNAFKDLQ